MFTSTISPYLPHPQEAALEALAASAAANIPGVDFASVTVRRADRSLYTVAATEPLASEVDLLQYELREGPCYAAVTEQRFILLNDVGQGGEHPRYGPQAAERGVRSQAAIQLSHDGELFASHAAVLLGYARQVESLGEAVDARQDVGTAVGIVMERHGLDRERAFAFIAKLSNDRNVKVRVLAQQIVDGTLPTSMAEEHASQK